MSTSCLDESAEVGQRSPWRFTREYVIAPALITVFHELYEAAFGPLRTLAMARQVLTAEEFGEQMTNPDVVKYVAWTADGRPVGMCALTSNLHTVPWISPEYFAARYPDQWRRRAVWYFSFLLAHPSQRHSRFADAIIEAGVGDLVAEGAICAYDMCAHNEAQLGLARRVAEVFRRTTGVAPEPSDSQIYYTLDFTDSRAS